MATSNTRMIYADAGLEPNFHLSARTISELIQSFGWVKAADAGQIALDPAGPACSATSLQNGAPNQAFDGNNSSNWQSSNVPTPQQPQGLIYDCGPGVTRKLGSYKLYFQNQPYDPGSWVVAGSNDGTTWTALDAQTGIAGQNGIQTFTPADDSTAYRYFRIFITSTNSYNGWNQNNNYPTAIYEWQLFDETTTQFPAPSGRWNPFGNTNGYQNVPQGFEIYHMADALQTVNAGVGLPCFLKIEYGCGTVNQNEARFCIWLSMGTGTDGGGNLLNATPRLQLAAGARDYLSLHKVVASGDTNRFWIALCEDSTGFICFNVERAKIIANANDSDRFVSVQGYSGANKGALVLPKSGPAPAAETDLGLIAPAIGAASGTRNKEDGSGLNIGLWDVYPFLVGREAPLLNMVGYFPGNLTPDAPFAAMVYGASRTYYPLNANAVATIRGVGGTGVCLRYE